MVDTLWPVIRFIHVDGSQPLMAKIDIEHVPAIPPRANRYSMPNQAFCDAEIAFLEAEATVINLGEDIVRPIFKLLKPIGVGPRAGVISGHRYLIPQSLVRSL